MKSLYSKSLYVGVLSGATYVGYSYYCRLVELESRQFGIFPYWPRWKVLYRTSLPYRSASRAVGWLADREIPPILRKPILGTFVKRYSCDMTEAERPELSSYSSLNDFFTRSIKPETRPISSDLLVSPADGHIQQCGRVRRGDIRQVKGITYKLEQFIGEDLTDQISFVATKGSKLCFCVVYLSPGKYHGFHSPADWNIGLRRHFTGDLLSVRQNVCENIPSLFCINERVLLSGRWKCGHFSMTAVGATNVGQIRIFDDQFETNTPKYVPGTTNDKDLTPREAERGEKLGEFRMGSTIVLLFEAPKSFKFTVKAGQSVRLGQTLGFLNQ